MKKSPYILGLNALGFNTSASLLKNNEIVGALEEERLTREKRTRKFPINSIKYLLNKEKISFEIRVSRGKGYSTADKNKRSDDTLNTIPIDSIYNPIVNVAWDVQTLPASIDGREKLTLEVESDGSTSAPAPTLSNS